MSEPDADMENAEWRKWESAAPFHSSLNKVQRDFRASALVLWKAFFSRPSPALAPAQFRLHTWHSEREASGQGRSGRAGIGGRGERERVAKVKVRNRTRGESDKKGTKEAAGCDRKINTYNVQNSQALFVSEKRLLWRHSAACRWTFSEKRAPDKWCHLEDGYLFYRTYVCLFFIKWLCF